MAKLRSIRERIVQFGPDRGLVGILGLPDSGATALPYVILINSGIIHRVGSNRVYVDLARRLASAGVRTLRFDLSGVGDSKRRTDVSSVRESVERDIADAIGFLVTTQGAEGTSLIGLCSGAFDAFNAALSQPRVVGAFMVDMPGPFRGWAHTTRHIGSRFFRLSSWRNPIRSLLGHSRSLVEEGIRPQNDGAYAVGARSAASRGRMERHLDVLLARGVRLHFIFTSGLEQNYNHASQFRSTFPRAARHSALSSDFFPDHDHSFATREMRERLIQRAVDWVLDGMAGAPNRKAAV